MRGDAPDVAVGPQDKGHRFFKMEDVFRHEWVIAPFRTDREALPPDARRHWLFIDAHRNHCGPYSAAGGLIRELVSRVSTSNLRLLSVHRLALLSVSVDIRSQLTVPDDIIRWLAVSREGNHRSWTLRLAHGVTDFLTDYASQLPKPLAVSFENVDVADPLDQEFIAVLLRRADPERLLIRVCSSSEQLNNQLLTALNLYASTTRPEPTDPASANDIPKDWRYWLKESSAGWRGEWLALTDLSKYFDLSVNPPPTSNLNEALADAVSRMSLIQHRGLARDYVESDCTSDALLAKQAYISLPDSERKMLHTARARELEKRNLECLRLGAIPFHCEHAGDAGPLLAASSRCMHLAFYDAALDLARRGRNMSSNSRNYNYEVFTRHILFSLLLLGRFDEVEAICAENLATSESPYLLARIAYTKAILNARYYAPPRRDYEAARVWAQKALGFMEMLPFSQSVAAEIAFLRNTLALVEWRTRGISVATQLLSEAIDYLAKEAPEGHQSERRILLHNWSRLHLAMKKPEEAIKHLTTLLEGQPGDTEAYFDRALISQRLGRHEEAVHDYSAAIQWSPPYPEPYFNRAQSLVSLGRITEAFADYARVLVLEPNHTGTLINRAHLFYKQGNLTAARMDVEAGLRVSPADARLLCLLGLVQIKDGQLDEAYESFTKAIEADVSLADGWANRALVSFKKGDLEGAAADSTKASALRQDANIFYNRGRIFEAQGKWTEAMQDYSRALDLAGENVRHIAAHQDHCRKAVERENLPITA